MREKQIKKKYDFLFKRDPVAANLFLLMTEITNSQGRVTSNEQEIADLMNARFEDCQVYAYEQVAG